MNELQKEYYSAFTQGFTSEQLKKNLDRAIKGDFQDDWQRELEERKKIYNASGRGIDFNKERTDEEEDERMPRLMTPTKPSKHVDGVFLPSTYGADIEAEQLFQEELHEIVDDMKIKLVDEKKILEGALNPEYGKGDWKMPFIEAKNELSNSTLTQEQWKSDSQNGSLITVRIPTSTQESNNSACIVELFNRDCPIVRSDVKSSPSSTNSCSGRSDDCGIEIDATNESSECTVPMISAAMLGTPSEVRWSPLLRSMESSVPNLPDVKS